MTIKRRRTKPKISKKTGRKIRRRAPGWLKIAEKNLEPPRQRTGRLTTLTPELQQDLVTVIAVGNYYTTACAYVGLPESTFYSWLKRGEEELLRLVKIETETGKTEKPKKTELIYLEFLEAIKKAEAGAEIAAVLTVKSAFGKNWQAAMTFLERRCSDRWRRRERHEITGADGKPVQVMIYLPDNKRD